MFVKKNLTSNNFNQHFIKRYAYFLNFISTNICKLEFRKKFSFTIEILIFYCVSTFIQLFYQVLLFFLTKYWIILKIFLVYTKKYVTVFNCYKVLLISRTKYLEILEIKNYIIWKYGRQIKKKKLMVNNENM